MVAETLSRYPLPADGGGVDQPPLRPTANYDNEPERNPDPTGVLTRAHIERYGPSAVRFIGFSPDAIIKTAVQKRRTVDDNRYN